jgi:hypothetical protein
VTRESPYATNGIVQKNTVSPVRAALRGRPGLASATVLFWRKGWGLGIQPRIASGEGIRNPR